MIITQDLSIFKQNILSSKPILSIDYGKRKIGIAISDKDKTIALPWYTIKFTNLKVVIETIQKMLTSKDVSGTVIGLATLNYQKNKLKSDIMFLAKNLAHETNPVLLYDESFSTAQAIEGLKYYKFSKSLQEKLNDQVSASIILEEVLNQIK